jgi:phosphatidylinositol alpha-1,6-mannosyltransferase
MCILFLTSSLAVSDGWGRYSLGFIAEARRRDGAEAALVPEPQSLRSAADTWRKPGAIFLDVLKLTGEAKRADLIHALTEQFGPLACVLGVIFGKPVVLSTHGTYGHAGSYPWYLRPLYRWAFHRAAAVVAVSRYTTDIVRRTFGRSQVEIVPGGFDPVGSVPERRLGPAPYRLLSVGALKRRKGYHTLIAALGILKTRGFAVRCRIIGSRLDKSYVRLLEDLVEKNQLRGEVVFNSDVPDGEKDQAYSDADLFVLPSEHSGTAFEGLGLVYLEALARGTPVIGPRQSGAEDVIEDGVNGFLVDPGDPEGLADTIEKALSDAGRWQGLSRAAAPSISKFAWSQVGGRMSDVYRSVISKP